MTNCIFLAPKTRVYVAIFLWECFPGKLAVLAKHQFPFNHQLRPIRLEALWKGRHQVLPKGRRKGTTARCVQAPRNPKPLVMRWSSLICGSYFGTLGAYHRLLLEEKGIGVGEGGVTQQPPKLAKEPSPSQHAGVTPFSRREAPRERKKKWNLSLGGFLNDIYRRDAQINTCLFPPHERFGIFVRPCIP